MSRFSSFFGKSPFRKSLFGKSKSLDRILDHKRTLGRRLHVESLEDRRMLAVLIGSSDDLEGVNGALPPGGQNLGSEPTVSIQQFGMGFGDPRDVFVYRAHSTGKLYVTGDFNFNVQDSTQTSLSGGLTNSVVIPVVGGEQYWIVLTNPDPGNDAFSVNYDLEIENFAAPIPASVSLSPSSDTGISNSDRITSDNTPTFFIQDDLGTFLVPPPTAANFGTIDSNGAIGYDVELVATNLSTGAEVGGNAARLGTSSTWTVTLGVLPDGEYLVSARTHVIDGVTAGGGGPNMGNSLLSVPIFVTITTGAPAAPAAPNLLAASDTGMFNNDNVTNKMQPAFSGVAPSGTNRVFVFARQVINNVPGPAELVGSTSDFILVQAGEFFLNTWEVTVEPLADAVYDFFAVYETVTGDLSPNGATLRVQIDTNAPNTPLLDLRDDTGHSLSDEITSDNTPDVSMTTTDSATLAQLFTDNLKFRIYDRFEASAEVLIYNSATDAAADIISSALGFEAMFTSATQLTRTLGPLADGVHNLKLEVEDRAGNISEDFLLEVFVDTLAPAAVMPNLLDASDSGMVNTDNVTNKMSPAFTGVAEINNKVFVYATRISPTLGVPIGAPELVGEGLVGSENSNGVSNDGLGRWEVTVEPLVDGVYDITVQFEDWAGNITSLAAASQNALRIVIDTEAPNTPYLDLLDDTGRHDNDNITKDNTPNVSMTTTDPNIAFAQALFTDNLKFRIYDRFENSGQEVLIYNSAVDLAADVNLLAGDMFTALTQLTRTMPGLFPVNPAISGLALADGVHNLKLEVEDRAGNISHDFLLEITVDSVTPPVSFGLPDAASIIDGLAADSDSGVITEPDLYADRITNDTTPRLWGRAEADTIVRVYLDRDADGIIDLTTDTFLGQTVALPYDGNDAYPDGYWELVTALDLNQIVGLPKDGLRSLLVTAEDVAGNPMAMPNAVTRALEITDGVDQLDIFIDTQGPRVGNVYLTVDPTYDLFDPKPSTNGFTPLVDRVTVKFSDLPLRLQEFLYPAVNEGLATTIGNYQLVGDHVGNIFIKEVLFNDLNPMNGDGAVAAVGLGSGGVIIDGGDRDDHGSSTAGPDTFFGTMDDINLDGWKFIEQMVNFAAVNSQNSGTGMLVAGASSSALSAITSVATVLGIPITVATTGGAVDLATVNFNNFAILYVPSDSNTSGGISTTDLNTLTTRKLDIQNYVNAGGSLVALTEANYATPYSWLELPGTFTIGNPSSDTQFQTQALIDAGLTITNTELLNGTPLHNTFTGPAGFNGLQPFVFNVGTNGINDGGAGDDEVITLGLAQGQFLGGSVMAEVTLVFDEFLPDDRYTLTVFDTIRDDAGNQLDGESQADSPFESTLFQNVVFDSGDGQPGTNFQARFTIDSRPEIGTYVSQNISIDINGNYVWDPANDQIGNDKTNVDLSFTMEAFENGAAIAGNLSPHELLVAGRFTPIGTNTPGARFFDQLATYGEYAGVFRWLIDLDSDGAVFGNGDPDGANDLIVNQGLLAGFNATARYGAIPVAGNFDRNQNNGDEIGLYYAGLWALDTNHDYILDKVVTSNLLGSPIVGDFDGNGNDDLAVFNTNQFFFDLSFNALANATASTDTTIIWGFPGVLDKPVAADIDQDGIDDIGLWVPRNSSATLRETSEWYFLISGNPTNRAGIVGTVNALNHPFSPVPFGNDRYAEFGDDLALPIIGNFDPPVTSPVAIEPNNNIPGDYDGDGDVDGRDMLVWQRSVATQDMAADGDHNGVVNTADLQMWASAIAPPPAPNADLDGDGDVDGRDFLLHQRTGNNAGITAWREDYNPAGAFYSATLSGEVAAPQAAALLAVEPQESATLTATADSPYPAPYWIAALESPQFAVVITSDEQISQAPNSFNAESADEVFASLAPIAGPLEPDVGDLAVDRLGEEDALDWDSLFDTEEELAELVWQ